MKQLEFYIDKCIKAVGIFCAAALIILVCIVAFNAIARYGFNYIAISLEEMAWHLNAVVFMLGMSYALQTESHVRVDLVYQNLNAKHKAIIDLLGAIIFLVPFCIISIYFGWDYMYQSFATGERSEHPNGLPYRFIVKGLVFLAFSLLMLASISFIVKKINTLTSISSKDKKSEQEETQ